MGTQDIYYLMNFGPTLDRRLDVPGTHTHGRAGSGTHIEERVRFHHGTATQLPFPDESFHARVEQLKVLSTLIAEEFLH